jgi:hypothetical protein
MRQIYGLENLRQLHPSRLNAESLANLLLSKLQSCRCLIYGCCGEDDKFVLAQLHLLPDTLIYDRFDQRIDMVVAGPILRNDVVPLTYHLQAEQFGLTGRCSVLPKVCGVDLYLQATYTCVVGDIARQRFSISIKPVLEKIKVIMPVD